MSHRMDTYANIAQKSCGSKVDTERRSNEMKFGLSCDEMAHPHKHTDTDTNTHTHALHRVKKTWKSQQMLSDLNFRCLKPVLALGFFCLCISNMYVCVRCFLWSELHAQAKQNNAMTCANKFSLIYHNFPIYPPYLSLCVYVCEWFLFFSLRAH